MVTYIASEATFRQGTSSDFVSDEKKFFLSLNRIDSSYRLGVSILGRFVLGLL